MTVAQDLAEQPEPSAETTASSADRRIPVTRASGFAALLLRLHFYAGVLVAPFLVVAALTGLLYTAVPQIDAVVYGDQLTVTRPGTTALPLAQQIAKARAAHPDGTLTAIQPGTGHTTTRVLFSRPDLGEKQHTVFVNPYTGDVQGTLTTCTATCTLVWPAGTTRNWRRAGCGC